MTLPKPELVWKGSGYRVVCSWTAYTYRQDLSARPEAKFHHFVTQPGELPSVYRRQMHVERTEGIDALGNGRWVEVDTTTARLVAQLATAIANFKNIPEEMDVNRG